MNQLSNLKLNMNLNINQLTNQSQPISTHLMPSPSSSLVGSEREAKLGLGAPKPSTPPSPWPQDQTWKARMEE